ncbi:MAG: hypothetical protein ACOYLB_15280 [Phototrophicaceae bacterium]
MMKRQYLLMIGLGVAMLMMAVPSFAQQIQAIGSGTVTANGDGRAAIMCSACTVTLSGDGLLAILDSEGDSEVSISGAGRSSQRETDWGTATVYQGFNGSVTISGAFVAIALRGENISLNANGTGRVWLRGQGSYTINGENGNWQEAGSALTVGTLSN